MHGLMSLTIHPNTGVSNQRCIKNQIQFDEVGIPRVMRIFLHLRYEYICPGLDLSLGPGMTDRAGKIERIEISPSDSKQSL